MELADTLVDDYDVVDLMHTLAERSVELFEADAAGIILRDARHRLLGGRLDLATRQTCVELFIIQSSEGPCLDCVRTGDQLVNVGIADDAERRWPQFVGQDRRVRLRHDPRLPAAAADRGRWARSTCSAATEVTLADDEIIVAQGLADIATIGLLQQRAVRHHEVLTEQLHSALNSRIVIEQAKGVLAERAGISVGAAFELMRTYSRGEGQLLRDTAEAVIAGQLDVSRLRDTRPPTA